MDETTPLNVLGISGSLRRGSFNTALLGVAGELMEPEMKLTIAEIGDLPLYNADDEREHGLPRQAERLRAQIAQADGLLFAIPEYNYSFTGSLKNAFDWASRPPDSPLNKMPTAIMGAGGRLGTARAQGHFRDIALHNELQLVQRPEVLVARPREKFTDDLTLTDERTRDQIHRLVTSLHELIGRQ